MRAKLIILSTVLLILSMYLPASAHYWRLAGPPEFVPSVNGVASAKAGETKTYNDGEGGVTTTLTARTFTSAEFVTSQPRYGTHRMRYTWNAPPDVIRPGELLPVGLRWETLQKWNRFSPQMMGLVHLDGSEDWYPDGIGYGELAPASKRASGSVRNPVIKVTTNNSTELTFYQHVACGGQWVRVAWKYRLVDGAAPAAGKGDDLSLAGTWYMGGPMHAGMPCKILQTGKELVFINEGGDRSAGRLNADGTVTAVSWNNLKGALVDGNNRIKWANGTWWYRK